MNDPATMRLAAGVIVAVVSAAHAEPPAPPITAIAFSPAGDTVLVGSQAGIEVRSWPELKHVRRLEAGLPHVTDLSFSPDGRTLAAAGGSPSQRGTVELLRWPEGDRLRTFGGHRDLVTAVRWRGESALIAASADKTVSLLDTASGRSLRSFEGHSRAVLAAVVLPDHAALLTAGVDHTLRLWNLDTGEPLRSLNNHTDVVHGLARRPSTDSDTPPLVASVSDDRTVRLWQPTIGRMVRFVRLPSVPLAAAWAADGSRLYAACHDGRLRVIHPDTVEVTAELPALSGPAYCLAVAPDGAIAVGGEAGQVIRINIEARGAK